MCSVCSRLLEVWPCLVSPHAVFLTLPACGKLRTKQTRMLPLPWLRPRRRIRDAAGLPNRFDQHAGSVCAPRLRPSQGPRVPEEPPGHVGRPVPSLHAVHPAPARRLPAVAQREGDIGVGRDEFCDWPQGRECGALQVLAGLCSAWSWEAQGWLLIFCRVSAKCVDCRQVEGWSSFSAYFVTTLKLHFSFQPSRSCLGRIKSMDIALL